MAVERDGRLWVYDVAEDELVEVDLQRLQRLEDCGVAVGKIRAGMATLLKKPLNRKTVISLMDSVAAEMNEKGCHWRPFEDVISNS